MLKRIKLGRTIRQLQSADRRVRLVAIQTLGNSGDTDAIKHLTTLLADKDAGVKEAAMSTLLRLGHDAVEPLVIARASGTMSTSIAATMLLNQMGHTDIELLLAILQRNHEWKVRLAAIHTLRDIGDRRAVESLLIALQDRQPSIRSAAVEALGQIRDPRAVEPLLTALRDPSVRWEAVRALGQIGDPRAVEPLAAALQDNNKLVREQAIEALRQIKDTHAVEALVLALKDNDPSIQLKAVNALLALGWQPKDDAQHVVLAVIKRDWNRTVSLGAVAVEPLVAVLKKEDEKDRMAVTEALGKIRDRRAVEPLIATLQDRDSKVRGKAAEALGQIGDPRAVEPLVALLKNGDEMVRAAAEALGHLGSAAMEPLLVILRGNGESKVREWAMCALAHIGDPRTVEPLAAAIQDRELSLSLRTDAAEALARMGDPRGVELLVSVLQDGNQYAWVRIPIIKKLMQIEDARSMEALETALKDDDVGRAAAEALGEVGDHRAIKPLETALRESSYGIKPDVARALARLGWRPETDAQRAELAVLRHDWNQAVSLGVVAVEPLVALLKYENAKAEIHHTHDSQAQAGRVRAAVETLGKIGNTGMEALVVVLKDKNYHWLIRRIVAETLGQIGDVRAFGPLVTLTTDGEVAQTAIGALQKLLEGNASDIPLEDLRRVVTLNEVVQIVHHYNVCGNFLNEDNTKRSSERIDCTQIRQLARQELIRRGLEA